MMKLALVLLLLTAAVAEYYTTKQFYIELMPFPEAEFWYAVCSGVLRDVLLMLLAWLLYVRKNRLRDRIERYFPVVVSGALYLAIAGFMVAHFALDTGIVTALGIVTGLNNNIFLVLLAAMCYHKWPTRTMKLLYFAVYFLSALMMIFDAFYMWQTSMHIQSMVFQNINIYSVQGVFATMGLGQKAAIVVGIVALLLLFIVRHPRKKKPNFVWSLFCVAVFTLSLNLSFQVLTSVNTFVMKTYLDMWAEIESEETRATYRNMLAVPINGNFIGKLFFDTDKIVSREFVENRPLTDADKQMLAELGIELERKPQMPVAPAYDKIVMLILESVHRDYIHYYNDAVPAATTPFLDELLAKYPHMDNFYSSAVPTTPGLNAVFRSHLIYDKDLPGAKQPSLFRSVQAAGWRGIFMNASSHYYANELMEYPQQFGMQEYYAKEYLQDLGYTGASGWGFHNDVLYEHTIKLLQQGRKDKMLLVTKTLDMHQPYPYSGILFEDMPTVVANNPTATIRGMYWVDQTLKVFFEQAAKSGLLDERTLFVITSDHNPHSGGEYTQIVANEKDRKSIAPIPLIFISKNLQPLADLSGYQYASQIDLAPTLLYLAGIEVPPEFMGRNLLTPVEPSYALGYFGGKEYYYGSSQRFEEKMDNPVQAPAADALSNYLINRYAKRHNTYAK